MHCALSYTCSVYMYTRTKHRAEFLSLIYFQFIYNARTKYWNSIRMVLPTHSRAIHDFSWILPTIATGNNETYELLGSKTLFSVFELYFFACNVPGTSYKFGTNQNPFYILMSFPSLSDIFSPWKLRLDMDIVYCIWTYNIDEMIAVWSYLK